MVRTTGLARGHARSRRGARRGERARDRLELRALAARVARVETVVSRLHLYGWPSMPLRAGSPAPLTQREIDVIASGGVSPSDLAGPTGEEAAGATWDKLLRTSLTVRQTASRLQVNPSRVRQRLLERSLYGVKVGSSWRLPSFQFTPRGTVLGIEKVLARLPADLSPAAVERWFSTPNPDLCPRDEEERALTPLEWLRSGNPPGPAAELAASL